MAFFLALLHHTPCLQQQKKSPAQLQKLRYLDCLLPRGTLPNDHMMMGFIGLQETDGEHVKASQHIWVAYQ